ncbi:iron ABC transporter permease [Synergistaceae bacterium OttesenSCG-928-I11]|nr:iron ABC transporter permease [Synergistaceae bacterium OttesenSCG-928-I11]
MFPIHPDRIEEHSKKIAKTYAFLVICLFSVILTSLAMGEIHISPFKLLKLFFSPQADVGLHVLKRYAILHIRLPRILAAALSGAVLAGCGVVLQGISVSNIASPFTAGASPGAAFGASSASLAALPYLFPLPFVACVCATFLTWVGNEIFGSRKKNRPVLSGLLVATIFSLAAYALRLFEGMGRFDAFILLVGNFSHAGWLDLLSISIASCAFFLICSVYAEEIEILFSQDMHGEIASKIIPSQKRLVLTLGALFAISPIVVRFGIFPLFGLIVSHLLREYFPHIRGHFFPLSILCGATGMCAIDSVVRTIKNPPAGMIILLAGFPLLLLLLSNRQDIPGK